MTWETLEKSSWIDAPFVTRIFIWLTFLVVLAYAFILKLKEVWQFLPKLADD